MEDDVVMSAAPKFQIHVAGTSNLAKIDILRDSEVIDTIKPASGRDGEPMNPDATKTVLYIEDNPFNLHLVKAILAARPHLRLLTAIQGTLGLESARQNTPDLILLDMHLPDMAGPQFLRQLRAEPATASIPVVIVSGDEPSEQRAEYVNLGVVAFVIKPFDIDQFADLVERCLMG